MEENRKTRKKKSTYEGLLFGYALGQEKILALFTVFVKGLSGKANFSHSLPLAKLWTEEVHQWGDVLTNVRGIT